MTVTTSSKAAIIKELRKIIHGPFSSKSIHEVIHLARSALLDPGQPQEVEIIRDCSTNPAPRVELVKSHSFKLYIPPICSASESWGMLLHSLIHMYISNLEILELDPRCVRQDLCVYFCEGFHPPLFHNKLQMFQRALEGIVDFHASTIRNRIISFKPRVLLRKDAPAMWNMITDEIFAMFLAKIHPNPCDLQKALEFLQIEGSHFGMNTNYEPGVQFIVSEAEKNVLNRFFRHLPTPHVAIVLKKLKNTPGSTLLGLKEDGNYLLEIDINLLRGDHGPKRLLSEICTVLVHHLLEVSVIGYQHKYGGVTIEAPVLLCNSLRDIDNHASESNRHFYTLEEAILKSLKLR